MGITFSVDKITLFKFLIYKFYVCVLETRKMQRLAREHNRRILDEQEMLNYEMEVKRKELDCWSKQLNKLEALTERERQKLDEEKQKVVSVHFRHTCNPGIHVHRMSTS